jgi:hypothetical protein
MKIYIKIKNQTQNYKKIMSYGYHHGFGYNTFNTDWNGDGLITAADFKNGAYRMGFDHIDADVAQSAFRAFDRNHNGYLDAKDARKAYGYLHRLYEPVVGLVTNLAIGFLNTLEI